MVEVVESILAAHVAAAHRAGGVEALREAAGEQERLSTGPRAMGNKAVRFKRILFAEWLTARANQMENGHE